MLVYIPLSKEGDNIGRALLLEFDEQDSSVFNEIMEILKRHPDFKWMPTNNEPMLSFPGLEIYPDRRKVYCGGQEIYLTAKEYNILCLLVVNKGRVLTYDQIYRKVWGEDAFGDESNAIGCHVRNLREKLYKAMPNVPFTIKCVREIGYCFEVNSE